MIRQKDVQGYYNILHNNIPGSPKWEIEVLCVAARIRPSSFLDWYGQDRVELYNVAHSVDGIAEKLGLHTLVAPAPSLWFPDKEVDTIDALRRSQGDGIAAWLFREASIPDMISKVTDGKMDAGVVLGYPDCCTKWHQGVRKMELGRWRSSKNRFSGQAASDGHVELSDPREFSPKSASRNASLTFEKYPFVSHVACSSCLKNKRSPTSRLNASIDKLIKSVDPDFHKRLVNRVRTIALEHPRRHRK